MKVLHFFLLICISMAPFAFAEETYYDAYGNQVDAEGNILVPSENPSSGSQEETYYDVHGNQVDAEGNILVPFEDQSQEEQVIDKSEFQVYYNADGTPVDIEGEKIEDLAAAEAKFNAENKPTTNVVVETQENTVVEEPTPESSKDFPFSLIIIFVILIIGLGGYFLLKK